MVQNENKQTVGRTDRRYLLLYLAGYRGRLSVINVKRRLVGCRYVQVCGRLAHTLSVKTTTHR